MIKNILVSFIKNNKAIITTYLTFVIIGLITSFVLLPKFTSKLIESLANDKNGYFKVNYNFVLYVFFSFSFVIFTDLIRKWLEDTMVPNFTRHVRKHIYDFVLRSHQSDKPIEIGKLLGTMGHLPYVSRTIAIEVLKNHLPHLLTLIILTSYFFYLDTDIGLLKLATLFIFLFILFLNTKYCLKTNYDSQKHYMEMQEKVKDKISNISSIYANHQEKKELLDYDVINKFNADIWKKSLRSLWRLRFYEEIAIIASFAVFNYIIINKKINKTQAMAIYVAELYYFLRIIQAAQSNFPGIFITFGEAKAMEEYMDKIISNVHKKELKDNIKINKPTIQVKNLYFRYKKNSPWIFNNLNFTFSTGDRVYIKGDSGCGKTTLFKLILGSLKKKSGSIHIFGSANTETIRDNISIVDQHSKLFNDTIFNNIKYSNNATEQQVLQVIKELNTTIFDKLEKGIHTKVGIDSAFMSGGQRQLIILLRTYFRKAKLILMDEPIAAVDENNVPLILKMIHKISDGRTLLVVSHNDRISEVTNKELELC